MAAQILQGFAPRTAAIGIAPPVARHVPPEAGLQRLRFHRGRHLTAAALQLEADNHEARFGLTCRALNDGVVGGFAVSLFDQTAAPGQFRLEPGFAIAPSGQDLVIDRPARFALSTLPRTSATGDAVPATTTGVGLLVLTPVSATETRFASTFDREAAFRRDQQLDPSAAPYQDPRSVDGVMLSLVMLEPLAAQATAPGGMLRAAYLLAEAEAVGAALASHAREGVAVAMLGIGAGERILWISRYAAARRGGGAPQPFTRAFAGTGSLPPRLAQAQVDTLLERLRQLRGPGALPGSLDPAELRHLPPAGILPAPGGVIPSLFPQRWEQSVTPIPLRQLDAVFEDAAAMEPFDLTQPNDILRWYVPVPDELFEADLLRTPQVSELFDDAVATLDSRVAKAHGARNALRAGGAAVEGALDTRTIPPAPVIPDPEAVPGEPAEQSSVPTPDVAPEITALRAAWFASLDAALLTADQMHMANPASPEQAGKPKGIVPFLASMVAGINAADDLVDMGFTRVQTEIYRLRQMALDSEAATKLVTFPVLAGIAKGSNALATSKGLSDRFRAVKDAPAQPIVQTVAPAIQTSAAVENNNLIRRSSQIMQGVSAIGRGAVKKTDFSMQVGKAGASGVALASALGIEVAPKDSFTNIFNASRAVAVDEISLSSVADKRAGILLADAIPGDYQDLRTLTIANRLENPAAMTARAAALRVKADALGASALLGVNLTGVRAPLVALDADNALLSGSALDTFLNEMLGQNQTGIVKEAAAALKRAAVQLQGPEPVFHVRFSGLSAPQRADAAVRAFLVRMRAAPSPVAAKELPDLVLARTFDPDPTSATDEAAYLSSAVAILESVVSLYRALEGRVLALRNVQRITDEAMAKVEALVTRWREALDSANRDLAEARHDLLAATALLAEETQRIAALDAHRKAVVAKHVNAVVFTRVRHLRPHGAGATSGRLLAGVYADATPAALARPAKLPDVLNRMMDVLGNVPIGWFAARDRLMKGYSAPKQLDAAFHWAANRSVVRLSAMESLGIGRTLTASAPDIAPARPGKRGRAGVVAGQIAQHYDGISRQLLQARGKLDLGLIDRQGWVEKRARAEVELSLNDLIEGGRDSVGARDALAEIDGIERVVSALSQAMRRAPAEVRLLWADRLSAFDGDPKLGAVEALPGFFGMEASLRAEIGSLHGWLFRRMTPGLKEGEALMSDFVQVTALLAANADADAVVTARLASAVQVAAGETVDIALDRGSPTIGTPVWFTLATGIQVAGKVRDVIQNRARVEIAAGTAGLMTLDLTTRVFVDARRASPHGYVR